MELISGFSECQLDDLRGKLVGERVHEHELRPEFVQHTLDDMEGIPDDKLEYPRPYDINQVLQDLAGFCRVCSICGYITDANCLEVDCLACGEFHCLCDERDYGFEEDDFEGDDDFEDEMVDFEGDDWEDDWENE